jgi:peptide/nickel transport system substrate-binding protein
MDVAPTIQNGRTLVPMRAIFEALGATVHWDDATRTIRAYRREDAIILELGNRTAWVNGPPRQLDVAPVAVDGRTMVPLRFVAEALGAEVAWVDATRTVTVQHTPYTPRPIGGTITFGAMSEPVILNPILSTDTASADIHGWISYGLVRSGVDLTMRNNIADRWIWDQANLTWTFWLRPDVRFSDGQPLTSRDVKFTFDTIMHPDYDGPRRPNVADVAEITTDGPHIVRFRMRQVSAPFLFQIGLGILPFHILGHVPVREHRAHAFSRQPIGAGPYLLDRIIPGQFAVLIRNPNFWMAPRPYIERIVIRRYADLNVMQAAFEAGDIDWFTQTPDARDRVMRELAGRVNFRDIPSHGYDYMSLNLEHPILRDRRVREALKVALDRPAMIRAVLNDMGRVIHSHQIPTSWASGAPNLNVYAHNPARARQLLDEAGWRIPAGARDGMRRRDGSPTGDPLRLNIMWNTGNVLRQDTAAMAVRQWRELGIDAADLSTEWSVMLGRFSRADFDIVIIGWALGLDPDPFAFFHSSQAAMNPAGVITGFNRPQFRNAEVDRLLEAGRLTVDVAERRAIYQQVDQILNRELPYIWLWQRIGTRGVWNHVRGLVESPIGTVLGEARYIVGGPRR